MIDLAVPGFGDIHLNYLVLDYNGTLAVDGNPVPGVVKALTDLASDIEIHVVTADTFGKAAAGLDGAPCRLSILPEGRQDEAKSAYIAALGEKQTCAVGNGRNDRLMLAAAALGIAVMLEEGAAAQTLFSADVVCRDILSALALLKNPLRLRATLRS